MFTTENFINFIRKQFGWLKGSADNEPGGASSKKLTGFWYLVILVTPIELAWLGWALYTGNWDYLMPVLGFNGTIGLAAFGIGVNEKLQQNKIEKGIIKNTETINPPQ